MRIKLLDCTLRDGGYVNNWNFGKKNIKTVISKLSSAGIEIIECGFLSNKNNWTKDQSQFNTIKEMEEYILTPKKDTMYVGMINLGEYGIEDIPSYKGGMISGIRIVFHQHQVNSAIDYAKEIKDKGYRVFIQPMATINYSDQELLELVNQVNDINPYAFYIVDSFGVMKQNDLTRMFYLLDNNLNNEISIGYHAHNNLQLAYSNAQSLISIHTHRNIIIDSSVFGMGRGAGNLNTELFTSYLNDAVGKTYVINPLLQIIDDILNTIYAENYWGYSLAHYLSAKFNCHPNYATYLDDKNCLMINEMSDILKRIDIEKRNTFDKNYIEEIYIEYQNNNVDDTKILEYLEEVVYNKEILIIAPGKSLEIYQEQIASYVHAYNPVIFSVNFNPSEIDVDYIFVSNSKRYHQLEEANIVGKNNIIKTSNIKLDGGNSYVVNYNSLLNEFEAVESNATLLLIKLLINCSARRVTFAGFDGYSLETAENYTNASLKLPAKQENIKQLNKNIKLALDYYSDEIEMKFITPTRYGVGTNEV
ncbi:aldolase catalytic domain-containing protein [Niameybacter massiliensis]|uniref:aldolase catalytic domain-containing protein n=1 Tax=Niameybacter massiliensis TaxID=1658108 RepID=UPI0006B66355|nr:aldolase catalytic domain-containing protein [Niameybacter massiliensis]